MLVQRFEGLAADVVTAGGGRVVKTVGDEVLFTADEPGGRRRDRAGAVGADGRRRVVPDVRVGLAHGEVLRSLGDVYGPTVNLASRLTAMAQPGTVLTDPGTGEMPRRTARPRAGAAARRARSAGSGSCGTLLVARAGPQARLLDLD